MGLNTPLATEPIENKGGLITTTWLLFLQQLAKLVSNALVATTKAEQETGVGDNGVTTSTQQFHPSAAKAWVKFNGTGTVAISASYNVASITDNGTGDYTINFTTPFSSASYCAVLTGSADNGLPAVINANDSGGHTASAFKIECYNNPLTNKGDISQIYAAFYGDQ